MRETKVKTLGKSKDFNNQKLKDVLQKRKEE